MFQNNESVLPGIKIANIWLIKYVSLLHLLSKNISLEMVWIIFLKLLCSYVKSEMVTIIEFNVQFYIELSSLSFWTLS